jgi:hypothetical protein
MNHRFAFGPTHTRLVDVPSACARLFTPCGRPFHLCRDEINGLTGFDQGFKTFIVFRRPSSTLEARR